jgi:hypothetical protein
LIAAGADAVRAGALPAAGSLAFQITTLDPVAIPGSAVVVVNGSGGGSHLSSLSVPSGAFVTAGLVAPVTDPAAAPIGGIQVTASNGAGSFAGSPLGGAMPLQGTAKVCLFGPCSAAVANLSVPLSVVGAGGAVFADAAVKMTVIGAPWTTGVTGVGTLTVMGSAHGPATGTSSTAANSGTVLLVTPVFVSTNISASSVVPVFGFLSLHFVPEPGTLVLLGSAVAGMALFGRSRSTRG